MGVSTKNILLYGASGHAKVIIDCLASEGLNVEGLFDDNHDLKELASIPVIGSYDKHNSPDLPVIVSIGNNLIRKCIVDGIEHDFTVAIHTSAIISASAKIGRGTVVMQGAVIQASTVVGRHSIVNTGASIDHDCKVGDYVHISPHATLCGDVTVGEGVHVGAGATVIQGIRIGKWAVIGAGTVVISDVADYCTVVGALGKIIKYNK